MTTRALIKARWGNMKGLVTEILRGSKKARNSDKWLIIKALAELGQDVKALKVGDKHVIVWKIPYDEFEFIPTFETIRRVRAEIQNKDGDFLPTDPEVIQARRIKEEVIRKWYANSSESSLDTLVSAAKRALYGPKKLPKTTEELQAFVSDAEEEFGAFCVKWGRWKKEDIDIKREDYELELENNLYTGLCSCGRPIPKGVHEMLCKFCKYDQGGN